MVQSSSESEGGEGHTGNHSYLEVGSNESLLHGGFRRQGHWYGTRMD